MSYTGTKLGQDIRFKDPNKDILSSMKTPKIYKTTVSKQNIIILPIIRLWLNKKISELLEFEDETLVNLIINLIKSSNDKIEPKNIQYQISGFLGEKTYIFMKHFWKLLISVQESYLKNDSKIPEELIPFKEEQEKKNYISNSRKYEKNKEYKEYNYNDKYLNDNDFKEKTKKELKEALDYYKDKKRNRSKSRSKSHEKRKYYKSRSREKEYKSKDKDRKNYKRSRNHSSSNSSSFSDKKRKKDKDYIYYKRSQERKRKYSDYGYSLDDDYEYQKRNYYKRKDYKDKDDKYRDYYYKKDQDKSRSISSDSSETFKI
jgi:hypothetical protein